MFLHQDMDDIPISLIWKNNFKSKKKKIINPTSMKNVTEELKLLDNSMKNNKRISLDQRVSIENAANSITNANNLTTNYVLDSEREILEIHDEQIDEDVKIIY
jgi:hypothetical protein